ncbi:MAG: FAD:protein FMN transferase [Acidimicrobiia bacterium]|nr:FAD:protein FMN transferase [Acidimicrobiia bacterium]
MAEAEHIVEVMGTRAHVIVVAPELDHAELLGHSAVARLIGLEQLWSRFLPASEVSRANANAGHPTPISRDTELLLARAIEAWDRTDGRFDPTVLPALIAAGYDRPFSELDRDATVEIRATGPSPGCADIVLRQNSVTLPRGVAIDPGGIGKGLAADLAVDLVMTAGAAGVCVNVGGDLRVAGTSPGGGPWTVTIDHPLRADRAIGIVELADEALVSSWRTRRAWGPEHDRRHHVIDPRTGVPARSGLAGVTVTAADAWWAEALATAVFLAGPDAAPALARRHGVGAILVRDDASLLGIGSLRGVVDRSTEGAH